MMITAIDGTEPAELLEWADEYGLTHPVVGDVGGAFYWLYGDGGLPMPVVIDRGMVLASVNDRTGYHATVEDLMSAD